MYRIRISKTQPKGSWVERYSKLLEPSGEILWGYKEKRISEAEYTRRYLRYLNENRTQIMNEIKTIEQLAKQNNKDAVLLCWCRKGNFCHRRILADWYKEQTGIEIQEL